MKYQKGFSLIELMITLVIIGIIAGFAVPSYQNNIIQSARKTDGMPILQDIMNAQLSFFANDFTYTTDLTDLNYTDPIITESGRYSIKASQCVSDPDLTSCVLLTATGIGPQAIDGSLTLDTIGNKFHIRTDGTIEGWLD